MSDLFGSSKAVFSDDHRHRYELERVWDRRKDKVLFVMLNPSVADADTDDQTIKQCCAFARLWGYGGIVVVNLYTLISTDPKGLGKFQPVWTADDTVRLLYAAERCKVHVVAWGKLAKGPQKWRGNDVVKKLRDAGYTLHCLGRTAAGDPKHPCRLAHGTLLEPYV
jgi:hypothetical protein